MTVEEFRKHWPTLHMLNSGFAERFLDKYWPTIPLAQGDLDMYGSPCPDIDLHLFNYPGCNPLLVYCLDSHIYAIPPKSAVGEQGPIPILRQNVGDDESDPVTHTP